MSSMMMVAAPCSEFFKVDLMIKNKRIYFLCGLGLTRGVYKSYLCIAGKAEPVPRVQKALKGKAPRPIAEDQPHESI